MRCRHLFLCALPLVLASCTYEDATDEAASTPAATERSGDDISVPDAGEIAYETSALEQMRRDASWRAAAERDRAARAQAAQPQGQAPSTVGVDPGPTTGLATPETPAPVGAPSAGESFDQISPDTLAGEPRLPIAPDGGGPTALRAQILLDRARFSPGAIDGNWGQNTAKAVFWFQDAHGLPPTGEVDRATWDALARRAGGAAEPLRRLRITAEDLRGPFIDLPEDVYARAELDCLCYESPLEMLAEHSHSTPELLRQLNPQVDFDRLQAGQEVWVPNVTEVPLVQLAQNSQAAPPASGQQPGQQPNQPARPAAQGQPGAGTSGPGQGAAPVAALVISKRGSYVHALNGQGRLLFHFPSTLGSRYDPSPDEGDYKVTGVHPRPDFHYQPKLFADVPDTKKDVFLPPGPNSPVGLVWMQLSKPNNGIHGTAVPETIGYASSHGCVRLTNWDAVYLSERIPNGVPVRFVE
jgi:lipoprotein-anchoring transpeptidase ErfK/SrfK